jgi:hypothetical protein
VKKVDAQKKRREIERDVLGREKGVLGSENDKYSGKTGWREY